MRFLIILQSLCAEMHGIAAWLARQPDTEVLLALERSKHYPDIPQAERIILKKVDLRHEQDRVPARMLGFMLRAEKTAWSLKPLQEGGRSPDIILVYSANGSGFHPRENFPDAFVVNYACNLAGLTGPAREAASLLELMQNREANLSFAFQSSLGADSGLAPLALDAEWFSPRQSGERGQLIFWLKDCTESAFKAWLKKIVSLARKSLSSIIFVPNLEYINLAENVLAELPQTGRPMLAVCPHRQARRDLFLAATLFISPSKAVSLDLLEAMACGAPLMSGVQGLPGSVECPDIPDGNFEQKLAGLLGSKTLLESMGMAGRDYAKRRHSESAAVPAHVAAIIKAFRA